MTILYALLVLLDIKTTLYNSLVLSHINYCLLVWGYEFDRIKQLQKITIRIITVSKYNAHKELLFKDLQILQIEDILINYCSSNSI